MNWCSVGWVKLDKSILRQIKKKKKKKEKKVAQIDTHAYLKLDTFRVTTTRCMADSASQAPSFHDPANVM